MCGGGTVTARSARTAEHAPGPWVTASLCRLTLAAPDWLLTAGAACGGPANLTPPRNYDIREYFGFFIITAVTHTYNGHTVLGL